MKNQRLWKNSFLLGFLFLIGALLCYAYGILKGEVQTGFLFIFPFLIGQGIFSLLGTIFLMFGIFCFALWFIGRMAGSGNSGKEEEYPSITPSERETDVDGILLIGPFPVIFSTKKSHIILLAILAFAIVIGIFLLFLFLAFFA